MFVKDRTRRKIRTLKRYAYPELISYFLITTSEVLEDELLVYPLL